MLADDFPDVYRFVTAVFPSEDDDVITSPYNSLLALERLTDFADCVLPIENGALLDICSTIAKVRCLSVGDVWTWEWDGGRAEGRQSRLHTVARCSKVPRWMGATLWLRKWWDFHPGMPSGAQGALAFRVTNSAACASPATSLPGEHRDTEEIERAVGNGAGGKGRRGRETARPYEQHCRYGGVRSLILEIF